MKQITTLSLGFTFAGCFLGAGYVSGQEIWQFFGAFGINGVIGLALAVALQLTFGILLLRLARITGLEELDKVVIRHDKPALRAVLGASEVFFMFGVCVIMYAGAGALTAQVFSLPAYLGSALLCAVVCLLSLRGFSALLRVFSMAVPLLVALTVAFSLVALGKYGFGGFPSAQNSNPLLGSWGFSALTFVSYNLFCSIGVLTPLAKHIRDGKTLCRGVALGCLFLFAIAFFIILSLCAYPQAAMAQLPMLLVAGTLHPAAEFIFALLLLLAMLGASLSCHVAAVEYLGQKSAKLRRHRLPLTLALVILGWAGSLIGFSDLVGTVYPLCGYCGFAALICVIEHYIHARRNYERNN